MMFFRKIFLGLEPSLIPSSNLQVAPLHPPCTQLALTHSHTHTANTHACSVCLQHEEGSNSSAGGGLGGAGTGAASNQLCLARSSSTTNSHRNAVSEAASSGSGSRGDAEAARRERRGGSEACLYCGVSGVCVYPYAGPPLSTLDVDRKHCNEVLRTCGPAYSSRKISCLCCCQM